MSARKNDSFQSGLMFYRRCFLVHQGISELCRPIAAKFCTMVGSLFRSIRKVQKFQGTLPKKL